MIGQIDREVAEVVGLRKTELALNVAIATLRVPGWADFKRLYSELQALL